MTFVRWRALAVFSFGYFVSYLFRGINLGFAPFLTHDLSLSAAQCDITPAGHTRLDERRERHALTPFYARYLAWHNPGLFAAVPLREAVSSCSMAFAVS